MNYDSYTDIQFTDDYFLFLFDSIGAKGILKKAISYTELKRSPNMYNLGLATIKCDDNGDWYADGDDVSNNGDRDKILATIANTVSIFINRYPDKTIYFKGSNKARTRLYQMAINHAYDELCKEFLIKGNLSDNVDVYDLRPFERDVNYTGFVIEKK